MPGYRGTKILEGATFKEFAISCFSAFPALSGHEDLDENAFDNSELVEDHLEKLQELNAAKEAILAMTDKQIALKAKEEHEVTLKEYNKRLVNQKTAIEKYNNMMMQVEAYEPPTEHHQFIKDKMKSEIEQDIAEDCDIDSTEKTLKELTANGPMSVNEWRKEEISSIDRRISHEMESNKEEIEQIKNNIMWIKQFKASLENPPVPA